MKRVTSIVYSREEGIALGQLADAERALKTARYEWELALSRCKTLGLPTRTIARHAGITAAQVSRIGRTQKLGSVHG